MRFLPFTLQVRRLYASLILNLALSLTASHKQNPYSRIYPEEMIQTGISTVCRSSFYESPTHKSTTD